MEGVQLTLQWREGACGSLRRLRSYVPQRALIHATAG